MYSYDNLGFFKASETCCVANRGILVKFYHFKDESAFDIDAHSLIWKYSI